MKEKNKEVRNDIKVNFKKFKNNEKNKNEDRKKKLIKIKQNNKKKKYAKMEKRREKEYKGKKKMNAKQKKRIKWITIIFLSVGVIVFLLLSPVFNIKQIVIIGAQRVNEQTVKELAGISIGQNIFNFNKIKSKDTVESNPFVSNVEIKRILPDKIEITLAEKVPTFALALNNEFIVIDNQGYAIEKVNDKR